MNANISETQKLLFGGNPMNTAERIYCEIKDMIINFQVVPGQKMQYQDLAEQLKVSRTPVKDALNMLHVEGFIEHKHNRGYFVAQYGMRKALEFCDVRIALETFIVEKAIEEFSKESLRTVKQAMDTYRQEAKRAVSRKRLLLDTMFHLNIAKMTKNETLVDLLRVIQGRLLSYRLENLPQHSAIITDTEHREIYGAIKMRNASLAVEKMRKHLEAVREYIRVSFIVDRLQ